MFIQAALHGHSIYSDGLNKPKDLVTAAQKKGITYLALTDHDTVNGIPELYNATRETQVLPIAGIEFLTKDGDLLALKPTNLKQAIPFLKWCASLKARKLSALEIIQTGINQYNCLFIIPHPCLFHNSLQESQLKEIYLSLTPIQRNRVAVELNNGATQVLNNKKRLTRIHKIIKKYPFHLTNGPDFHHRHWIGLSTSTLPDHEASYTQFEKLFIQGKLSSDFPEKLSIKNKFLIYSTQISSFLVSRYSNLIYKKILRQKNTPNWAKINIQN